VLDHVRAGGTVTCAAESRPGFADMDDDGHPSGLALELCRAVALAVIGPAAKVQLVLPEAEATFAGLAAGGADLAFLSGGALSEHRLATALIQGPTVFLDSVALLVPDADAARAPADLAGRTVCVMIGSAGQRAAEATLGSLTPPIARLPFREDVELRDAYNVGRCDAVAGEVTWLEDVRRDGGINGRHSRLLRPPLAVIPLLATAPASDGAWAGLVFAVLNAIIADAAPPSAWRAAAMLEHPALRPTWRADIRAALGGYADMRDRNLSPDAARLSAPWPLGLLTPALTD
jgi:general L-amino acid transport system substrate-binding protein